MTEWIHDPAFPQDMGKYKCEGLTKLELSALLIAQGTLANRGHVAPSTCVEAAADILEECEKFKDKGKQFCLACGAPLFPSDGHFVTCVDCRQERAEELETAAPIASANYDHGDDAAEAL